METQVLTWIMDIFFALTLHILYKKILDVRFQNRIILFIGWIGYILTWNFSSYVFHEHPLLNSISGLIINFIVLLILYLGNVRTKIVLVFMVMVLGIIAETMVVFLGYVILGINVNELSENRNYFMNILNAISKIFWFIFVKIIMHISGQKKHIKIALSEWIEIFTVPVGSLIIFFIVAWDSYFSITIPKVTVFAVLLVINILTYYIYQRVQSHAEEMVNNQLLKQQNEYYKSRYSETEKQWANLRKIRHDMINNYVLELSYLENKRYDDLKDIYISAIGNLKNRRSVVNTGNIGIDSIINYKMEMAKELNIIVSQEIKIGGEVYISNGDLNILLGNLFDNAIEAVSKIPQEKRKIDFKIVSDNTAMLFEISNTFDGNISRNHKKEIITTKEDNENHGIGLKAVKEIVDRYEGDLDMEKKGDLFLVKVFLYYKENIILSN